MNYFLNNFKNYINFSGRARRKEFWMFFLFNFIVAIVTMILDNILGTTFKIDMGGYPMPMPYGYICLAYALAAFIPGLGVTVRRLHDVGKSGWFYFIGLIPIIGGIWLLVLFCTEGTMGENKYGPDPKASDRGIMQPAM